MEEVSDAESGFLGENPTLLVALLGEDAIIQVWLFLLRCFLL